MRTTPLLTPYSSKSSGTLQTPKSEAAIITEDADITFVNITLNYELEAKLFGPVSAYVGAGLGLEIVRVDDSFDIVLDSDVNFTSQVFLGLRASFDNGFQIQAGPVTSFEKTLNS